MNKVPNTISDKQMAEIQKRAAKVAPSWTSDEATRRRKLFIELERNASKN